MRTRPFPLPALLLTFLIIGLSGSVPAAEETPAPVPPEEAPARMSLPEGFTATLFAGEPDVVQPMAFTIDDRGRLWVVESQTYPGWITDGSPGKDRILIFEDENGDGRFDSRKVFFDKGTNLTGIEVGFGGVWLTAVPHLLFIPDANGDDVPDDKPQVLLDGWDLNARHNVVNGLTWGPDGWLYGCNGILSNSKVGKPGTPEADRVVMNCGVWRYHPVRHVVEWFASGSTNPWGLDFDERGEMFITNCVIKHLFHVIPGGHYERMFGQDHNPHVYGLMESCADHIHWGGGKWQSSRGGEGIHDKPGGGHAHAGCMIYLGDNWPAEYRGNLFTCNIHGNRVNQDVLTREGSGYVASHGADFLMANDSWFRGLELKYGPDGAVYVTDWSDTGECHDYKDIHRENGRIYRIAYGQPASKPVDLQAMTDAQLVELQQHDNVWHVRHARRILQERAAAGKLSDDTAELLGQRLSAAITAKSELAILRYLWTLHAIEGLSEEQIAGLLKNEHGSVVSWTIRVILDHGTPAGRHLQSLRGLAADPNQAPQVRLALAAGLQRLPLDQRWAPAEALLGHAGDAGDHNIPLMLWYGIEPLVTQDRNRALQLLIKAQIPLVRQFITRRIAELAAEKKK